MVKRHIDQIRRDQANATTLKDLHVQRISVSVPHVQCFASYDRGWGCVLAIGGANGRQHNYAFSMDRFMAEDFHFSPLPRDRELLPDEARNEIEVRRVRQEYANQIANQIAHSILDALEKDDPKFGYSPEEWYQIHREKM